MGDGADDLLDRMSDIDEWCGDGDMDYDTGEFWDWSGIGSSVRQRKIPHCKYCKKRNLHWIQLPIGWRLHDKDGKIHECTKHPSKKIKPVYESNELLQRCLKYLPDHLDTCPKLTHYNNPPCNCRNETDKILKNIIKDHLSNNK